MSLINGYLDESKWTDGDRWEERARETDREREDLEGCPAVLMSRYQTAAAEGPDGSSQTQAQISTHLSKHTHKLTRSFCLFWAQLRQQMQPHPHSVYNDQNAEIYLD